LLVDASCAALRSASSLKCNENRRWGTVDTAKHSGPSVGPPCGCELNPHNDRLCEQLPPSLLGIHVLISLEQKEKDAQRFASSCSSLVLQNNSKVGNFAPRRHPSPLFHPHCPLTRCFGCGPISRYQLAASIDKSLPGHMSVHLHSSFPVLYVGSWTNGYILSAYTRAQRFLVRWTQDSRMLTPNATATSGF
jgi:hypothetical protein